MHAHPRGDPFFSSSSSSSLLLVVAVVLCLCRLLLCCYRPCLTVCLRHHVYFEVHVFVFYFFCLVTLKVYTSKYIRICVCMSWSLYIYVVVVPRVYRFSSRAGGHRPQPGTVRSSETLRGGVPHVFVRGVGDSGGLVALRLHPGLRRRVCLPWGRLLNCLHFFGVFSAVFSFYPRHYYYFFFFASAFIYAFFIVLARHFFAVSRQVGIDPAVMGGIISAFLDNLFGLFWTCLRGQHGMVWITPCSFAWSRWL